jgi:hypothetical protein
MIRTAALEAASRGVWAQIGISACTLLLPPIAVGAAVFIMLPMHDDAVSVAPPMVAEAQPSNERAASLEAQPAGYSLASARPETSGKDTSRVLNPTPVHVTVPVAPPTAGAGAPPAAPIQTEPTAPAQAAAATPAHAASIQAAPAQAAPVHLAHRAAPALPPAATPPPAPVSAPPAAAQISVQPVEAASVPPVAAVAPAELADSPPERSDAIEADTLAEQHARPATTGHFRAPYLRRLTRRSFSRNDAHAARWATTSKNASWLQNFLNQLGSRPPPGKPAQRS